MLTYEQQYIANVCLPIYSQGLNAAIYTNQRTESELVNPVF